MSALADSDPDGDLGARLDVRFQEADAAERWGAGGVGHLIHAFNTYRTETIAGVTVTRRELTGTIVHVTA